MNLANSSGEFGGTTTAPRSVNRCLMFGSSTAALVCLLSVAMISGSVPGAPKTTRRPRQPLRKRRRGRYGREETALSCHAQRPSFRR
jgi:hypothetical protein